MKKKKKFLEIVPYWVYFDQGEDFKLTTELCEKSAILIKNAKDSNQCFVFLLATERL